MENCTDTQIQEAVHDLFVQPPSQELQILGTNTTPEQLRSITKGQLGPSTQITSCFLTKNDTTYSFSIHVSSLSDLPSPLKPSIPKTHILEWYIGFENLLAPPQYNIRYQLAARIEPTSALWGVENGFFNSLHQFL